MVDLAKLIAGHENEITRAQVLKESTILGMEADWNSELQEWTIKVPGSPEAQWYYTNDNHDALLTMRTMKRDARKGRKKTRRRIAVNAREALTAHGFLKSIDEIPTGYEIMIKLGSYEVKVSKTAVHNMVAIPHGLNKGELVPFKLVKARDHYQLTWTEEEGE